MRDWSKRRRRMAATSAMAVIVALAVSNAPHAPAATPPTTTSTIMLPTTVPGPPAAQWPPALFFPAQSYDVANPGSALAAADLNGDGRADLALNTGDGTPDQLVVLYQGAGGAFERAVHFDTDAGASRGRVRNVLTGDVNADGRVDVVLHLDRGLNVFLQRNGTFADRAFQAMDLPGLTQLADLDGDGVADLALAGGGISVRRGLGDGTFGAPVVVDVALMAVSELVIADVTGDGRNDLVAVDNIWAYGEVVVFPQLAGGGFAPGVRTSAGGSRGRLATGDFNSDGRLDVAVTHTVVAGGAIEEVRFLIQRPDGTLLSAGDVAADRLGPIRAADVDGNGRTDLVGMVEGARSEVYVVLHGDDRRMAEQRVHLMPFASTFDSTGFVVADVTGDRRPDVAVVNDNSGLDVARSVPSPPPVALQSPYTAWAQPASTPLDGIGTWMVPLNEPVAGAGQLAASYLYGHGFSFAGSTAAGIVGLSTGPAGKFAIFSVTGPDGTSRTAAVPFDWRAGRFYFALVLQAGPGQWRAMVYDHTAGAWISVGQLSLESAWGKLSPVTITIVGWSGDTATGCPAYPRADVLFFGVTGYSAGTSATLVSNGAGAGGCPGRTSAEAGWVRYQVGGA